MGFGYLLLFGAGALMWLIEMYWFAEWWGPLGVVGAFIFPPLAAAFPFIIAFVEGGAASAPYFLLWAIGIVGLVIGGLSAKD